MDNIYDIFLGESLIKLEKAENSLNEYNLSEEDLEDIRNYDFEAPKPKEDV